jgi:phage-related protein
MVSAEDLWEVRAAASSKSFHSIGFLNGQNIVVLAHAFQKKTDKTPKRAIKIAEERKKDYFRRKL